MMNVFRRVSIAAATLVCLGALVAPARAQSGNPGLDKQLGRLDLGIMGIGQFTNQTTGTNNKNSTNAGQTLMTRATTDFNGFAQLRYTASKWVGLEFNYVHGRNTYNFTTMVPQQTNAGTTLVPYFIGVGTNAQEYSIGYVVHPRPAAKIKPFASIGAGTIDFAPTAGGGDQNKPQGRAVYFYSVGADVPFTPNFGLRAEFRQKLYLHPDFQINIYRDLQRDLTSEPAIGVYLRF